MKLKLRGITIAVGFPELCAAALVFGAGKGAPLAAALFSAAAHETGHLIALKLCGVKTAQMKLSPVGGAISPGNRLTSYRQDLGVAAAGPAVSLALAGLFFLLSRRIPKEIFSLLALTNATLGLMNLLPTRPLDGYRILRARLAGREATDTEKRLRAAGVFSVVSVFILFAVILIAWGFNGSLLIFGIYLIYSNSDLSRSDKSEFRHQALGIRH